MPAKLVRLMVFKYILRVTVFDRINLGLLLIAGMLWASLFTAR